MTSTDGIRQQMKHHLDAALALVEPITNAADRERAARLLAEELLPEAARQAKAIRGEVVRGYRADGLKLREVAELLDLSTARVDQLAKGK